MEIIFELSRILFITGTDTGVGKTLLTAALLFHLRRKKIRALAMKPFCSGSRDDVDFLQSLQPGELSDELMNPFFFSAPLAPMVAARMVKRKIRVSDARRAIAAVKKHCDFLLVEGAGGLLSPCGENFSLLNLIEKMGGEVVIAGWNRLGTINHTMLNVRALEEAGIEAIKIVMMRPKNCDKSSQTNVAVLRELLRGVEVFEWPFLGGRASSGTGLRREYKKIKKVLARLVGDH